MKGMSEPKNLHYKRLMISIPQTNKKRRYSTVIVIVTLM